MANFLSDHAAQLIRSSEVATTFNTPDGIAAYLRRGKDGSQFLFLINNQESTPAKGDLQPPEGITGTIHYQLDPFDAKILYLPPGEADASKGIWYPQPVTPPTRPTNVPAPIAVTDIRRAVDPGPTEASWQDLPAGASIEDLGIFDRRYIFYRTTLPATIAPSTSLAGELTNQHAVIAQVGGQSLSFARHGHEFIAAPIPTTAASDNQLLLLFENGGRYNGGDGINDRCGLINPVLCNGDVLPKNFTGWKSKFETGDPTADVNVEPDQSWASARVTGRANQVTANNTAVFRATINLTDADLNTGGKIVSFGSLGGTHRVFFNGKEISPASNNHYDVSSQLKSGVNVLAVIITAGAKAAGIGGGAELDPIQLASASPLKWQISGQTTGQANNWQDPGFDDSKWDQTKPGASTTPPATPGVNLTWYRLHFSLPATDPHIWVPWKLQLEATGNGFIYLNGHALGRAWEAGPQTEYFLPECWLNFGPGSTNVIALCMRPTKVAPQINTAVVSPYDEFAESR